MATVRIYLVEDSSITRQNLAEALGESAAIEIAGCADDEATAIDWLRHAGHTCDLVIVDIFLKSGSGLGVLKAMADGSRVPGCIVLSNHSTPEMRAKCLELGAIEVFDKSNELDEMLAWIKRFSKIGRAAAASRS
jgi:DNA-binding NarL/FixJ family response regulator